VGDDNNRHAPLLAQVIQQLQHGFSGHIVQGTRWLIAQKQPGILGKGPGNGHPLLLAAGELGRKIPGPATEAHHIQRLGRRYGIAAKLGCDFHILQRRQVGNQIVKLKHKAHIMAAIAGHFKAGHMGNIPAVKENLALGNGIHAPKHIQKGGFSRAGGAQQHHKLSLFHLKRHSVQRPHLSLAGTVDFLHIFKFNICHCLFLPY